RGRISVAVAQTQTPPANLEIYRLETSVVAYYPDGRKSVFPVRLHTRDTVFSFFVEQPPLFVDFDPEKAQVAVYKESKPGEYWRAQARHGEYFMQKYYAYAQLVAIEDSARRSILVKQGLEERYWALRKAAIEALSGDTAREVFDAMLRLAVGDSSAKVRAAALSWFASLDYRPPTDAYRQMLEAAVADSSYRVVALGLQLLAEADPERAVVAARQLSGLKNDDVRFAVASIFLSAAAPEAQAFTENALRRSKDLYNKLFLIHRYGEFIKNQPEPAKRRGIAFLQSQTAPGLPTYVRLFAVRALLAFKEMPEVESFLRNLKANEPEGTDKTYFDQIID
ncbi:MAG: hypothetical protein RMM53_12525, partial [Bacteroidia bacterium]|nr:hypothetical protein [Bacteroidia bacterium]